MKKYLLTVGDALSQLLNAVVFFSGNANESLSGRCWRQRDHWLFGTLRKGIDWLFRVVARQRDHCEWAFKNDIIRASEVHECSPS